MDVKPWLLLFLFTFCQLNKSGWAKQRQYFNPVILVPGDGGSQMQAKLNKTHTVNSYCKATYPNWYELWLNAYQLFPMSINCWADNMKLIYDNKTRTTRNNYGVEIRIPGFGNTTTVEYLDLAKSSYATYFNTIVDMLVKKGYTRGVNIHGTPYDFRKAANEHGDFFDNLTALVEDTFKRNNKKKVIFVCHSMGSPLTLYFLNHKPEWWKEKYVRAFVTLSGVWAGTARAVKVFAEGDNLGSHWVSSKVFRAEQRTNPSLAWLMPGEAVWDLDEVLVQSENVNISLRNFGEFYARLNTTDGYLMWNDTRGLVKDLQPPGIEHHCLYGTGVSTTEKLMYYKFPDSTPVLKKGDGDGTVNTKSLEACTRWQTKQKHKVHVQSFKHVNHLGMLKHPDVVGYLEKTIESILGQNDDDEEVKEMKEKPGQFWQTFVQQNKLKPTVELVV